MLVVVAGHIKLMLAMEDLEVEEVVGHLVIQLLLGQMDIVMVLMEMSQ